MSYRPIINVDQYSQETWNKIIFPHRKEQLLNDTSQEIQKQALCSSINTVFRGQNICLKLSAPIDGPATVFVDSKMNDGLCGEFNPEKNNIRINKQLLKDGKLSLETDSHETTHKLQNVIGTSRNQYGKHTLEYEYATIAYMSSSENEMSAFGISTIGRLYMSGCKFPLQSMTDASTSLYALSPMERHACLTAMSISEQLPDADLSKFKLDHLSYCDTHLANAILDFQETYYCKHMSVSQIYQAIDNAQTFIALGYGITNDLEANIAYDMISFLEYENSELSQEKALNILYNRLNHDAKKLALSKEGYSIIDQPYELIGNKLVTNNKEISFLYDLDQFNDMDQNTQTENPLMIANFAFEKEVDVFHYLHCPEAFEEWLFSESSLRQLPREIQEGLGEILGEKYSLKNRQVEIERRIKQQSKQIINEDVGYVFER